MLGLILIGLIVGGIGGFVLMFASGLIAKEDIEFKQAALIMVLAGVIYILCSGVMVFALEIRGILALIVSLAAAYGIAVLLLKGKTNMKGGQAALVGLTAPAMLFATSLFLSLFITPA